MEVFPSKLRTMGAGFCFACCVIGSFVAPFLIQLAEQKNIYPIVLLGACSALGCIVIILFKETIHMPLQFSLSR